MSRSACCLSVVSSYLFDDCKTSWGMGFRRRRNLTWNEKAHKWRRVLDENPSKAILFLLLNPNRFYIISHFSIVRTRPISWLIIQVTVSTATTPLSVETGTGKRKHYGCWIYSYYRKEDGWKSNVNPSIAVMISIMLRNLFVSEMLKMWSEQGDSNTNLLSEIVLNALKRFQSQTHVYWRELVPCSPSLLLGGRTFMSYHFAFCSSHRNSLL